jgi:HK97 family phage prohead protease
MGDMISRFHRIDDLEIKRVDRTGRTVTAYATFFDQEAEIKDRHGHYFEKIHRSGFSRTISRGIDRVQVYYNHGYGLDGRPHPVGHVPMATPQEIKSDGKGLLTVSRYNDGELADACLAAWEGGQIKGQSFSGRVHNDRVIGRRDGLDIIERTELGLREYGPTPSPAYEGEGLVAIRSKDDLAELIRSILADNEITPATDSPRQEPRNRPGSDTDTDSPSGHSSRNARVARARAARLRMEYPDA